MRLAESVYPIIKVYSAGSNLQSSDHRPSTPLKRPPWVVLPGGWRQSFLSYPKYCRDYYHPKSPKYHVLWLWMLKTLIIGMLYFNYVNSNLSTSEWRFATGIIRPCLLTYPGRTGIKNRPGQFPDELAPYQPGQNRKAIPKSAFSQVNMTVFLLTPIAQMQASPCTYTTHKTISWTA